MNEEQTGRESDPLSRPVTLIDERLHWVRRPLHLVSGAMAFLVLVVVVLFAIYAYRTTVALTMDVASATSSVANRILVVPVNVIEGLVSLIMPLIIVGEMVWHRRWRTLITSAAAVIVSVALAYLTTWAFDHFHPFATLAADLTKDIAAQTSTGILPYVAVISALLAVSSSASPSKLTRVSWWLLAIVLVFSVLQGDQSLPGALITVLIGLVVGNLMLYAIGDTPNRATGADLVALVRHAGLDASRIVRVDATGSALEAWRVTTDAPVGYTSNAAIKQLQSALNNTSAPTKNSVEPADVDIETMVTRARELHPIFATARTREYVVYSPEGTYQATLLDSDEIILSQVHNLWQQLRFTAATQSTDRDIVEELEGLVLMERQSMSLGIAPEKDLRVAASDSSALLATEIIGEVPLSDEVRFATQDDEAANGSEHGAAGAGDRRTITDAEMDEVWKVLQRAHAAGLSHRNIHAGLVTTRDGHTTLRGWENGSIVASDLSRTIDLAQTIAMLTALAGADRAVASARRSLSRDALMTIAPVLQNTIIPEPTRRALSDRKQVAQLRGALVEEIPEAKSVGLIQLNRFSLKTTITLIIGVAAVFILLGSINFEDLKRTLAQANPWWMVAAFATGLLTYVGAGVTLRTLTQEKLPPGTATLSQIAGSVVGLVAPAGIGPAALNLRYLQKQKVKTPVAVATVTLAQLVQFVTTVLLLIILGLLTGEFGQLSAPSGSVIVVTVLVVAALAVPFLFKRVRHWIWEKIQPTVEQIWPRVVWVFTNPSRLGGSMGGALIQTVGYVAAFACSLAAFGGHLPITTLAITYLISNSLGSVVPTPGGIGPVEAALTAGLTLAGIPYSVAFSTALLYRLLTFWGRVPLGWVALRIMQKKDLL